MVFICKTLKTFSSCPAIFVHGRNDENFGMKIYYDLTENEKSVLIQNDVLLKKL